MKNPEIEKKHKRWIHVILIVKIEYTVHSERSRKKNEVYFADESLVMNEMNVAWWMKEEELNDERKNYRIRNQWEDEENWRD